MRLPGFTAEASVNMATKGYRLKGEPSATNSNLVRPARMNARCFDVCMGHCGGTYACAMGCTEACRGIHRN